MAESQWLMSPVNILWVKETASPFVIIRMIFGRWRIGLIQPSLWFELISMQMVRLLVATLMVVFTLVGCERSNSSAVRQAEPVGGFGGHVAVLPSAENSYLPADYDFLYPQIDTAVRDWLKQHDLRVVSPELVQETLDANDGQLRRELQSRDSKVVSEAMRDLIWTLMDTEQVDAVLLPQVLANSRMLDAPYPGASWDGVEREFVVNGERQGGNTLQIDTATLVIGVYNRFGQPEYFGRGGLDFLHNATRAGGALYASPKQPGQVSQADIKEAVSLSLQPWLNLVQLVTGMPERGDRQ